MLRRIASRLTYANVVSTAALFLALGLGTSYAAEHLGRNTVGSAQIRTGAVRSAEVHDRSLRTADLALSARNALRGKVGPAGPQGPAGTPAVSYFAVVGSAGQLVRGNAKGGGHTSVGSGTYNVTFGRDISACAYVATIGTADATPPPAGHASVASDGQGGVVVQTTDAAGNPQDLGFHVVVAC